MTHTAIHYACGHRFIPGAFGVQEDYAKGIPKRQCGQCIRQLENAAPALLAALETIKGAADYDGCNSCNYIHKQARAVILAAKGETQ